MIRFGDAVVLAATKLKTRKVRTIVTAVLASLLFAVLVVAFTMVRGGVESYARYSKNGLSSRYITTIQAMGNMEYIHMESPELIVLAKERNKLIIAQKKADAKRLGLVYNAADEPPVSVADGQGGTENLNLANFAANQVYTEAQMKLPTPLMIAKDIATNYRPLAFYGSEPFGDTNNLVRMKAGKEIFDASVDKSTGMIGQDTLATLSYLSRSVVNPFMLKNADQTVVTSVDATIPVVVPYREAEKALGLEALPKTATDVERLARIDDVKRRAAGATISVCYRNSSSQQSIEQAKQQIAEIQKRKGDKTYVMPTQQYALPDATTCGPVVVTKDTRSAEEKLLATKQQEFDVKYGLEILPVQKKLTFRIVGLAPDTPDYTSFSTLDSLVAMVGGSTLRGQWVIPAELVDASIRSSFLPRNLEGERMLAYSGVSTLVEFANAQDAKQFVSEQGCNGMDCMAKPFITYFGSNSVLLEDVTKNLTKALGVTGLVISTIAAILMMGMIGRVVTDSRRETAVFRAIGAKRNDIRAIYTLYVIAFSCIVAVSAVALGTITALVFDINSSQSLTTSARLMFIESGETAPFRLVGLWPEAIALLGVVVVFVGFTAMLLPLSRNLVRSPLKDMRDE